MDFKKISEFQVGEDIQGYYLVKSAHLKMTANNKRYLDLNLMDSSGDINAKLWDVEEIITTIIKPSKVMKFMGKVTSWQNVKQLTVNKYRPINDTDEIKIEDFKVDSKPKIWMP